MPVRRFIVMFLCMALLLCACAPVPSSGGTGPVASEAAVQEPIKSITNGPFTIALSFAYTDEDPRSEQRKAQQAVFGRMEKYLNDLGWQIRISIREVNQTDPTIDNYIGEIKADIACGATADGYQVDPALANKLFKQGLTQDVGPLCQRFAPQLYDRYQVVRINACGIPMKFRYWIKSRPVVLYLENSVRAAYDKPIANADDLIAFLEAGQTAIMASDSIVGMYDVWAAQQGYYKLADYGIPGFFYAPADDPDCTPVPLEQISGFEEIFQRVCALEKQGKVASLQQTDNMPPNVHGYLSPLTREVNLWFLQLTGKRGADYTAIPLQGCTAPALDSDNPDIRMLMAVPAISKHGDAVAALAQWALASPDGYVFINYGKQDVDYRLTEDGIEYLMAGAPLSADDWKKYEAYTLPAMCTFQGALFDSEELEPSTVYQARNVDTLMRNPPVLPPIWKIKELRQLGNLIEEGPFDDVISDYRDVLVTRYMVLDPLDMGGEDQVGRHPEEKLKWLAAGREQMSELAKKLKARLKTMMPR